jgi:cellobiose phosphorylase
MPAFTPTSDYSFMESDQQLPKDLQFYNGYGGFTKDGKEYVIITSSNQVTPTPWSNVIANPNFGTVISESGQAYTWFQNAHELRLTPWNNDPITDAGGEHFYIRDEHTGRFWSPTPLPAKGRTPYVTRHGLGYTVFEHLEQSIRSEMTVFVDPERPVKYTYFKVRNESQEKRQVSLTGYVEWVLGDLRHKTMMHIITELELNSGAIIAHNSYHTEFGQMVTFFDSNETTRTITTDRNEFIGRNGTVANPFGMTRSKLSGKTGAGLDPCGVMQVQLMLDVGEEKEIVFRMGTGMHMNDITYLIREGRGRASAREALAKVKKQWKTLHPLYKSKHQIQLLISLQTVGSIIKPWLAASGREADIISQGELLDSVINYKMCCRYFM